MIGTFQKWLEGKTENELTKKRLRRFFKIRRAVWSCLAFFLFIFISLTAEFWANSKPIFLVHNGSVYFPVVENIHPTVFGQSESLTTDYRKLKDEASIMIWPLVEWDPFESNNDVTSFPSGLSSQNWFGTDDRGRDVLSRLLYGFRYSIGYAVLVWFSSYLIGVALGGIMGYKGGWFDLIGQRMVEIFDSLPTFLLLLTLVAVFGASMPLLVIVSAVFGWMMISVYTRGEFLKLRRREFVEAARASGAKSPRIIFTHILPNALGPILTFTPFTIAAGVSGLAALDYLGFGLPPPTPSWGELLQQAQKHFTTAWWLALFPSLALFVTLVTLNFIGDGVRTAFDPKSN